MKKLILLLALLFVFCGIVSAAVNINTATKEELDSLKGIGPVKAQAIIDYRTKNGPFSSVDALEKVSGIGPKTLAEIRGDVSITGANAPQAAKPATAASVPAAVNKTPPAPMAKPVEAAKTPTPQPAPPAAKAITSLPVAAPSTKVLDGANTAPTSKPADAVKTTTAPATVAPTVKTPEPAAGDGQKAGKKSSKVKEEKKAGQPADAQVTNKKEKKSSKSDKTDGGKKDKKDKKKDS